MSYLMLAVGAALAGVEPLLETEWGQGGDWGTHTPVDTSGEATPAGCTTIATAQLLYYYRYQATGTDEVGYGLDNEVTGPDIEDGWLYVDLTATTHDWDAMAKTDSESRSRTDATAQFIYHVAASLNVQFGDPSGSAASGKQLENAVRYQWGYNSISRRTMNVISKTAFGYSDTEWTNLIRSEIDAGRPVLYMAQEAEDDIGHAFVLDGYRDDGTVHVNWGWGGYANGYYDPIEMSDHRGRRWNRDAMIYVGLEPEAGYAAAMLPEVDTNTGYTWTGNGSLISRSSGSATGYGLTKDEASVRVSSGQDPIVFFQWEVDDDDGSRLEINAETATTATITYGQWADRSEDRVYRNVTLPFVLDPSRDGHTDVDGEFFVIAVALDGDADDTVYAEATSATAPTITSASGSAITVDGHTWNGNASIIANTSGSATGYGLTKDETMIHPGSKAPVVFFQWEIDTDDGTKLELDADGLTATVRYGLWNGDRSEDVSRTVTLPATVDPAADGLSASDGEFYVISVSFSDAPASSTAVTAEVVK